MIDFGGALVGCIVGLTLRGVERVVLDILVTAQAAPPAFHS